MDQDSTADLVAAELARRNRQRRMIIDALLSTALVIAIVVVVAIAIFASLA